MATTVIPAGARAALPALRGRAGFGGTLRSELTKIRSVRSTYWSLIALVVITIGISALFAYGHAQNFSQMPAFGQTHQRA
jgi:ABC-2 type transport system permease protein